MATLNDLPKEILTEILSRLPTESALECKSVCKPWRDFIHQPSFSQMHLNHIKHSGKLSMIIIEQDLEDFYYTEFDDENCDKETLLSRKTRLKLSPEFHKCLFVSSCNGLICFHSWYQVLEDYRFGFGPTYICNPVTGEYITLPDHEGVYRWNGFGYIPSTNEYKVVRICFAYTDLKFGDSQVYTVGSGKGWRDVEKMGMNWEYMKRGRGSAGVFANGALHWVNQDNGAILAFDLIDEKFSELPAPPCLTRDGVPGFATVLGVLGDCLSATYSQDAYSSEIWLLKKNKGKSELSWSKEFSFNNCLWGSFEFTKSGRLLCYGDRGKIYSGDRKALSAINYGSLRMSIAAAISHKNTLVSLKALGEKDTKTMGFDERAKSSEVVERSA